MVALETAGLAATDRLRVAFVCTGNRARSPLAEALLRLRVDPDRIDVCSFGTLDRPGEAALVEAVSVGRSLGVDLSAHRSRPLPRGSLEEKDLVIGFEPAHVAAAVVRGGAAGEKTFLLLELPDLLDGSEGDGAEGADGTRRLIGELHAERQRRGAFPQALRDPYGASQHLMAETARLIDTTVSSLAAALFGPEG